MTDESAHVPTLVWDGGSQAFPDLAPPARLVAGLEACHNIQEAIARGELERTHRGLTRWVEGAATGALRARRRKQVAAAKSLLGPRRRLEEAEEAFTQGYAYYLTNDPAARAALWLVRVVCHEHPGASWVGAHAALAAASRPGV